ncbi:MAG: ATPase [Armatimonadetes bacterium]|nr:ATPase [Armatimonadota bacterium]
MALPDDAWLLGVDAGGTRTRAWLVRAGDPEAVHTGEAEGANWSSLPVADCMAAVEAAAAANGMPPIASVCVCAAGYHPERHAAAALAWLHDRWPTAHIRMETDLLGAWAGAFGGHPGVVLVAGTGSVAYGRGPDGSDARAGGWGPLVDDRGSGYWVGRQALAAVARAADGRGPRGRLVAELAGSESPAVWVRGVIAAGWDRARVASLAEKVARAAAAGDPLACTLLKEAGAALSELAAAVERRLGGVLGPRAPVALVGGLANAGDLLVGPLAAALAKRGSRLCLQRPLGPPALGALLLAAQALGGEAALIQLRDRLILWLTSSRV